MTSKPDIIKNPLFKIIGECGDSLNVETFVIGGWVRDSILKRNTKEIEFDIVCEGNGILLAKKVAEKLKLKNIAIYKNFGTAAILYKNIKIEFNGTRKESYTKNSRNPKVEKGNIEDDQKRRDFTINAMSVKLNKKGFGEFIDPFNGINDIEKKIIRTPLDPIKTYDDDPLRMIRAIRFASILNFEIEKKSLNAIKQLSGRLKIIQQERITDELNKIILSQKPSYGINLLSETGLLNLFFPEFEKLRGIEVVNGISHKDNFYHTLQVLDNTAKTSNNIWLRWAAILHDIAKPKTKRFNKKNGWTFHGHEHLGSKMVLSIFRKLKLPMNENMKYVQKLVLLHLRPIGLSKETVTDSAIRRLLFDAQDDIDDLMKLCHADITSKNERKVIRYQNNLKLVARKLKEIEENDKIRNWRHPINGKIIIEKINIKGGKSNPEGGKNIGIIKENIKEAILDGKIKNNYEEAEKLMYEVAKKIGLKPR
tara:strand:- start:482 stop:1921 length:1440 start_codon:yes stop_codon:yes gene_type:complete